MNVNQNKTVAGTSGAGVSKNTAPSKPQPPIPSMPPVDKNPPVPVVPKKAPSSSNPFPAQAPGWRFARSNPGTLADVSKIVNSRVLDPSKIYKPQGKKKGLASNIVQSPASIVELARALKNDPQLIFEHVYNNIDWEPGWGVMKGGLGALLDGCGNSFDQSMLLVELLREAGFTATYVMGQIELNETQFDDWFNTSHIFAAYWYSQYANIPGNWPNWTGTEWTMVMSHVWVEVDVGGNTYSLDPSLKQYTRKAPVSGLDTILGYNETTFLSNAASGATITGDYVQNMNAANINADLVAMTSNLVSYIDSNTIGSATPGTATVDDILGGQAIVPITLPFAWNTALPYEMVGDTPTRWTGDVPLGYKTTLQVQYPHSVSGWAIDETFTSDQLAGARLTLTFDSSLFPVLSLDGVVVATGSEAQGVGTWNSILLTVNHNAYAYPVYPQQWWQSFIYAHEDKCYLIGNAWGMQGDGQLKLHYEKLAAAKAASTPVAEAISGEWAATIFSNWMAQASRVSDLIGRMNNTHMNMFHQVGMVLYDNSGALPVCATDFGGMSGFSSTLDYDFSQLSRTNTVSAMHGVALEAAVLAQFNGVGPAMSTTTVIETASRTANVKFGGTITAGDVLTLTVNDAALGGGTKSKNYTVLLSDTLTTIATAMAALVNGDTDFQDINITAASDGALLMVTSRSENQTSYSSSTSGGATETIAIAFEKIYLATPSNWATGTNVSSILSGNGYSGGEISYISGYIGVGIYNVLIGDTPGLTIKDTHGDGFWVFPDYAHNGGAFGLISTYAKGGDGNKGKGKDENKNKNEDKNKNKEKEDDPIGVFTGNYFYNRTDMTLGSQAHPYSLSFERSYSSALQYTNGPLGWGWSHNHAITAAVGSDGMRALGSQSGKQGAVSIVELFVSMALAADSAQPIDKLIAMSLADAWWVSNIVNNIVMVTLPEWNLVFVKQPDGSYTAPNSFQSTLTQAAGQYTMTTPDSVEFNFNTDGQIATWVSPAGVTVTYTYSSGKLSTISNGMGRTLTLHYTGDQLTSVTDGTGRTVSYTFDVDGNLDTFEDAESEVITYVYDQPGRMTQYFLPANPMTAFLTNVYDSLSRVQSQDNSGGQTSTWYIAGARTEIEDPLSNSRVRYFNSHGFVTRSIDPFGNETIHEYDGLDRRVLTTMPEGNSVELTFDENNNVLTKTQVPKPGSGLSNIVETWTYDPAWAKVATYQDGNGNTTTLTYDVTQGTLLTIQRPVVGMLTPTVTMTWNARGQMLTREDESGVVTKFVYDATYEKLTSQIVDFNAVGHLNLTTAFSYDSVGNIVSVTNPNGYVTTLLFDDERRLIQKVDTAPFGYVTNYGFDSNGCLLTIDRQTGGSPAWQNYTWTYSVSNKKLTLTDPASHTTTWTYDAKERLQTMTDAESRQWQYDYDALDRISQITDPTSTVCDTRTYTDNGKLESIEDARSNVTQYTYDGFDRLDETIYADTTFEQNSVYDDNGNVLTRLTRSGNSIVDTYDVLNRLETRSPTGQATVTLQYDLAGRLQQASKAIVSGDPSSGALTFTYDTAGRFYQEAYPDGKTVTHVLDDNGNRTKTTWPDGYYVDRVFDEMNRLTDIKLNGSLSSAVVISYNDLSQRTGMTFSNGTTVTYTPQLNEDVTSIVHAFVGSNLTLTYGYNNVHETDSVAMSDGAYMFHPAMASVSYGTADAVNAYPTVGGNTYSYDGNMNISGDGTWTFGFNTQNQMVSASKAGTSVSYVYDSVHRQTQKTVGSTKSRYVYAGWQRIADYDGTTGNLQTRHVYGPGLDEPLMEVSSGGTLTFLHADKVGSIVATTNNSGVVTNQNQFGPFGETPSLGGTTFGFTGQRFDPDTGLYYFKNRYYSPAIGRFLQPDPVGYVDALNLYQYCANNPLDIVDPMGEAWVWIWIWVWITITFTTGCGETKTKTELQPQQVQVEVPDNPQGAAQPGDPNYQDNLEKDTADLNRDQDRFHQQLEQGQHQNGGTAAENLPTRDNGGKTQIIVGH